MPRGLDPRFAGTSQFSKIQTRVGLVLVATTLMLAVVMYAMQHSQSRQMEAMLRERALESQRVLGRILELRASGARNHADDYTRWDEFVEFVHTRDPEWAQINLTGGIPTFGLDVAWVLDARRQLVVGANPSAVPVLSRLPFTEQSLARRLAREPIGHFFASTQAGVLEIWTSSIQPSEDFKRSTPPAGYYVVGRLWTPERITELASVSAGDVRIVPASGLPAGVESRAETGRIEVRVPFPGINGRPVAGLEFSATFVEGRRINRVLKQSSMLAVLGAVLSLVLVWWAVTRWVARPLAAITRAMREEDATQLTREVHRHDELGEVARLVAQFFAQRDRLIEARKVAEDAAMAKSHFLANISHELRTPMHGILSFSRFGMRDAELATRSELHENFLQINQCGESLLTLLNALLDLSKLEAGRMSFAFSDVSMAQVVDVAADEFRSLFHEQMIELRVHEEPDLPPVVADRMRLIQVLRNLVSNAAKFTPAVGVVVIRLESAGDVQRVSVEDSGRGIPAGEEELIFNKFVQASHTNPRTSGGTGLGLAICREIVEAHEGRIWAENRLEGGARVVFEVPVAGPASAHESDADRESDAASKPGLNAKPIATSNMNQRWGRAA
ncbi:MAG: hypothetical protein HOP12_13230 [Candidatus Eisenbacteria bacterium]|uniref:histidine kinase n=1 Tax=Eiseniibacteriota bacterium TaxID=2212470 RepID=A0A849SR48_UNCEI|nr:hypothetical protein [Candidatus Eisenbacteria bacterium]